MFRRKSLYNSVGLRRRGGIALAGGLWIAAAVGCVQEMANQPRYEPLQPSAAFANGMSSRPPVPGTVPRGQLQLDEPFFTGMADGQPVSDLPPRVLEDKSMEELLTRGRQRFGIFCAHCHGEVGGGTGGSEVYESLVGMVVLRGFPAPPTFHQERLRQAPLGHFFDVIANGFGRMPAHGYLVPPEDRWAIAAYIRTLQLSQYARAEELPAKMQSELESLPSESAAPKN